MIPRARSLGRVLRARGPLLLTYAAAVVLVPLSLSGPRPAARPTPCLPTASDAATTAEPPARLRKLSGIWWRYEAGGQGERVRFYYFHGDGTGLYRYGRVGLTNTHSFDYDIRGDRLVLDFRKTGEHHEVRFELEEAPGDDARDWLRLIDDPREPQATRYFRESDAIVGPRAAATDDLGPAPAGHMWIDLRRYATGGQGFAMYQLRPAGIDGRGVGWFHRGDFDDWSTEALTYRIAGDRLELSFSLAGQDERSRFTVRTDDEGARWLVLDDDPRDYWHDHRYLDIGPSFGAALAPLAIAR